MRLWTPIVAALGLAPAPVLAAITTFVAPSNFNGPIDPSQHPVRYIGDSTDLIFNTTFNNDKKFSLVLYQLSAARAASYTGSFDASDGPFEYIKRDLQPEESSANWIIKTERDLSESPMFAIATWEDGVLDKTDSATEIFNISRRANADTSPTVSGTSGSPPGVVILPTISTSGVPSPSTTTFPQESSSGLSTGAVAGIGVGVTLALIISGLAGWYVAWRGRKKGASKTVSDTEGSVSTDEKYYELEVDNGRQELDPVIRYEMDPERTRVELDSEFRTRAELDPELRTRAELDPNPRTKEELP
ncbi:hypothetical protein OQA88_10801 [Cercophora sp. LCS_1]